MAEFSLSDLLMSNLVSMGRGQLSPSLPALSLVDFVYDPSDDMSSPLLWPGCGEGPFLMGRPFLDNNFRKRSREPESLTSGYQCLLGQLCIFVPQENVL